MGDTMSKKVGYVSPDKMLQVITTMMAAAHSYHKDWPKNCLVILNEMARQVKPLLEILRRDLCQELKMEMSVHFQGIVLVKDWCFVPGKPKFTVCYTDNAWILIDVIQKKVYHDNSGHHLAEIVGRDIGGTHMFIERCAYNVAQIFEERHQRLDEYEDTCLLDLMNLAFEGSKFPDICKFVDSLRQQGMLTS